MRALCLCIVAVFAVSLLACSPGYRSSRSAKNNSKKPTSVITETGYPNGYENWFRFNLQTVIRDEPEEARDLYYNQMARGANTGSFPQGSVLVKAQYTLLDGRKSTLFKLSVMTKDNGSENGGWQFSVYDPKTGKRIQEDTFACAICHSQRSSKDHVFSERSGI
ncbi:MAG TPA: hypothetical protein EYN06_09145 [Myxococcales bacterium]|nr:hypothetical protein [Myxococcales bacterium]HIN86633.1 hypothetical protein [Myxococcales bacterium]